MGVSQSGTRDAVAGGAAPVLNVVGEKVGLGPCRRELLPLYQRWDNDFEVTGMLLEGMRPKTLESEETWYADVVASGGKVIFTVYELSAGRPIGRVGLYHIDEYRGQTAEYGLRIGEKAYWGRGYGTEATRLVMGYGFAVLGLHNIVARVFSYNERSFRLCQRAGFRMVGRLREAHRVGERLYDVIYMDCLAREFQGPLPPAFRLGWSAEVA